MTISRELFTSESVTSGHPDKLCDRISDAILDAYLRQDSATHAAVEVMATETKLFIAGEVSSQAEVDIAEVARQAGREIGYLRPEWGFAADQVEIIQEISKQSEDIAAGVENSWENRIGTAQGAYDLQGAGDQGMMFGYACSETEDFMPAPIWLAHRLAMKLEQVRRENQLPGLLPDGKTQVTVKYEEGKPVGLETVVVSSQHDYDLSLQDLREGIAELVIKPCTADLSWGKTDNLLINPAGAFNIGGPLGDTGLTGRKIIVDTYGGMARHGGGAFSGKDASKVDRSAAYATRWVAKHIVAADLAEQCELQVAYAIGAAHPVSIRLDTFGTEKVAVEKIEDAVSRVFDLRPAAIVDKLGLTSAIFTETSAYGHFGRNIFPWEKLDYLAELKESI